MSDLKLVLFKDNPEVLLKPTEPYVFADHTSDETFALSKHLVGKMYEANGVGLAANQVGLPWSIFVIRGAPTDFVFFNPNIVIYSPEQSKMEEACLSFPGLVVPMKRSTEIRIRFADYNGDVAAKTFQNMTARVCQHEFAHLQGRMWFEGCSRLSLERAITKAKKQGHDYSSYQFMRYTK